MAAKRKKNISQSGGEATLPNRATTNPLLENASLTEIMFPALSKDAMAFFQIGIEGAKNTQRAYRADLQQFEAFCTEKGTAFLPAGSITVAEFVSHLAGREAKFATISRKLAAISHFHKLKGFPSPTTDDKLRSVMEGVKRKIGVAQKEAGAFELSYFKKVVSSIDTSTLSGFRDKVILLLGFTSASRRSELHAVNLEDIEFTEECVLLSMHKSKTNQTGEKEEKAIFYSPDIVLCPVRVLQKYITKLGRQTGPLLVRIRKGDQPTEERLTDVSINKIVKKYMGDRFSAHSLRASFVSIAKENGADDLEVMRQTKHKTTNMIRRYTRISDVKRYNAAKKLGL